MKQLSGKWIFPILFFEIIFLFISDEEKRKHCHSTSVKNLQHCPTNHTLNTDEEQIHELMSSLLDKIDKELNPSISTDSCCKIFNASSTIQHHISINSSDNDKSDSYDNDAFLPIPINDSISDDSLQFSNDLFQSLDDYKHSIGILLDDDNDTVNKNFNRVPSRKLSKYIFQKKYLHLKKFHMSSIGHDSNVQ
jgi:hypothetical protein